MSSQPKRPSRPDDDVQAAEKRMIIVICGMYSRHIELPPHATVSDVRSQWRGPMKIPDRALPCVNGHDVLGDTPLWDGDVLSFVVHSGEMGSSSQALY